MKKNNIAMILVLLAVLAAGMPVPANANTSAYAISEQVVPYYLYLSEIGATLSIEEDGYATCSGNINIFQNYNSEITITLQRSRNGGSWSNVTSWSKSFSGIGSHSLEKSYYVMSGYTYRVLNTAKVKSGSTILETATCYSPEKEY